MLEEVRQIVVAPKKVTNCGGAKKFDILRWHKKRSSKNGYTAICHAFLHCSTVRPCWMKCDKLWWHKKSYKLRWHKKMWHIVVVQKHSKNGYTAICHAFLHCSTLWPCWMKCDKLWWRKKVTNCGGTKKWQIVVAQNNFTSCGVTYKTQQKWHHSTSRFQATVNGS